MRKNSGQLSFADTWLGSNPKINQQLDKISQLVNWRPFEEILSKVYNSSTGRPSHPLLLLFKALLLQTWHNLSDYALEEAIDDRLSFRRFVSLSVSDKTPDHSVFSRFRNQLIKQNIHDQLFIELNRQLEERGLILKKGTLIDATVIEAAPKKPLHNEDGTTGTSKQDPEAQWTRKGSKFIFGYKAHVGVDQESELVRRITMTPANVHDGKVFERLVGGDEEWVFADKAYDSAVNHNILHKRGVRNGILKKAIWNRALDEFEKVNNRLFSKLRYPVERIFGTLKRSYRYRRGRYLGLKKNQLQLTMMCMAYNLRRMQKLCA